MERKKRMTKNLISDSLKTLMNKRPFDKITIKMITDEAGVIRPTFYNYFCDKYEVLEWIFSEEIIESVKEMFRENMYQEGMKLLFTRMKNDSVFYRKAFAVEGQNSFKTIVKKYLTEAFEEAFSSNGQFAGDTDSGAVSRKLAASFYAVALEDFLYEWMCGDMQKYDADEMLNAFGYLMTHSFKDYM
ncbi:MAG: TetR/AcrR family transcriptional regulator C-terminal domain-containing protein [Lachnospiraceae bacterium]|nr:TetR/AcrR family transcriptional regulator C-terminal domain-containing protein [Lachnospiraceae bacterium]